MVRRRIGAFGLSSSSASCSSSSLAAAPAVALVACLALVGLVGTAGASRPEHQPRRLAADGARPLPSGSSVAGASVAGDAPGVGVSVGGRSSVGAQPLPSGISVAGASANDALGVGGSVGGHSSGPSGASLAEVGAERLEEAAVAGTGAEREGGGEGIFGKGKFHTMCFKQCEDKSQSPEPMCQALCDEVNSLKIRDACMNECKFYHTKEKNTCSKFCGDVVDPAHAFRDFSSISEFTGAWPFHCYEVLDRSEPKQNKCLRNWPYLNKMYSRIFKKSKSADDAHAAAVAATQSSDVAADHEHYPADHGYYPADQGYYSGDATDPHAHAQAFVEIGAEAQFQAAVVAAEGGGGIFGGENFLDRCLGQCKGKEIQPMCKPLCDEVDMLDIRDECYEECKVYHKKEKKVCSNFCRNPIDPEHDLSEFGSISKFTAAWPAHCYLTVDRSEPKQNKCVRNWPYLNRVYDRISKKTKGSNL